MRKQSKLVSNPENFYKLKRFMEDDHLRNCKVLDLAEAREKDITIEEVRAKREKAITKHKKLVAINNIVWMSDEMSESDSESTVDSRNRSMSARVEDKPSIERPGNA